MPWQDGTLTPEDVAGYLGVPVSPRLTDDTDAARRWAFNRRCNTPEVELFFQEDVHRGAVLYAGVLYQARATPQGFAGYDETGAAYGQSTEALYRARELVGLDPVIA